MMAGSSWNQLATHYFKMFSISNLDVGFLRNLMDVPIEKLSVSSEKRLRTILEILEESLLKEVNNVIPDPERRNDHLIDLMKKKSQAGAGMLKYSQNVLNCVRIYRVVKPKSDLVVVRFIHV